MKTALILISLISLVSVFTLSQIKVNESLRSDNSGCYGFIINPTSLQMLNYCKVNMVLQISVTATSLDKTQAYGLETQCLVPGQSQLFELHSESAQTNFTLKVTQTEC